MKFFLVISIIAFWWVSMNSPGNIGITNTLLSDELLKLKIETSKVLKINERFMTKMKIDHFGFQSKKPLIK